MFGVAGPTGLAGLVTKAAGMPRGWRNGEGIPAGKTLLPLTEDGSPGGTFRTFLGCPSGLKKRREDLIFEGD